MCKFCHPRWHKTFLGIYQQHTYWMYQVIDEILNENKQIEQIIEIGTAHGALSVLFGLETFQRELDQFVTIDIETIKDVDRIFDLLNIKFIRGDCFKDLVIPDKKVFLFCDGGNKAKEFNYFVPKLKSGSIVGVHDFGRELTIKDIDTSRVEPIKEEEWNKNPDNIMTSFWRVK